MTVKHEPCKCLPGWLAGWLAERLLPPERATLAALGAGVRASHCDDAAINTVYQTRGEVGLQLQPS